jgi:hypothetical protein
MVSTVGGPSPQRRPISRPIPRRERTPGSFIGVLTPEVEAELGRLVNIAVIRRSRFIGFSSREALPVPGARTGQPRLGQTRTPANYRLRVGDASRGRDAMHDLVIRGGTVVDGTGVAARPGRLVRGH